MAVGLAAAMPSKAPAATLTWYSPTGTGGSWAGGGSDTFGPYFLNSHDVLGDIGTEPYPYPGQHPFDQPAGDYCAQHRFSSPSNPLADIPFGVADGNASVGSVTGLTVPSPAAAYQIGNNWNSGSANWASACQVNGLWWGFWLNAGDPNGQGYPTNPAPLGLGWCYFACGTEHDVSFGANPYFLPWYRPTFGPNPALVLSDTYTSTNYTDAYSSSGRWGFICALLADVSTDQILQFCLDDEGYYPALDEVDQPVYNSQWSLPFYNRPFTEVRTVFAPGTTFATELAGSASTTDPSGPTGTKNTYSAEITIPNLQAAVAAANAKLTGGAACPPPGSAWECYSSVPESYELLGLEDGTEMWNASSTMGSKIMGPFAYTTY